MLNIRKMELSDKALVVAMDEEFYSGPAVDHKIPVSELENTFDLAMSPDYPLDGFILTDENGTVGFGYASWYHSTDVAGLCVMLEELFLKQEARGKGYGTQYIQYAFDYYKNARRFRLEVTKENEKAAKLYRALGFEYISYDQMAKDVK